MIQSNWSKLVYIRFIPGDPIWFGFINADLQHFQVFTAFSTISTHQTKQKKCRQNFFSSVYTSFTSDAWGFKCSHHSVTAHNVGKNTKHRSLRLSNGTTILFFSRFLCMRIATEVNVGVPWCLQQSSVNWDPVGKNAEGIKNKKHNTCERANWWKHLRLQTSPLREASDVRQWQPNHRRSSNKGEAKVSCWKWYLYVCNMIILSSWMQKSHAPLVCTHRWWNIPWPLPPSPHRPAKTHIWISLKSQNHHEIVSSSSSSSPPSWLSSSRHNIIISNCLSSPSGKFSFKVCDQSSKVAS